MADLIIHDEHLVAWLRDVAAREKRSVEDVLKTRLVGFADAAQPTSVREVRLRMYARARRYWEKVGDTERAALTDADLDEQFWVFDNDGIPRLKSDQGTVEVEDLSLLALAEIGKTFNWKTERDDISENSDEIVAQILADEYARQQENTENG